MFINIDDDYFLKYYGTNESEKTKFSSNSDKYLDNKMNYYSKKDNYKKDILNPKEGLNIGNLFYDSYIPYKNYKPRELVAKNEKEHFMLKIQELCFAQNDLNLYLDLYPNDQEMFNLFRQYTLESEKLSRIYAEKYGPLELNQDTGSEYMWYQNPWPWEVSK
ncbi:MAG: spore coat protein CotJB [Bacilli bacterium]|nr:spore coat protein CotJB [Bacilli bacterium]